MSDSEEVVIPGGIAFEGTADEVAKEVFEKVIAPMFNQMASMNKDEAGLFAFSIMWLSMAQYSSLSQPEPAKKSIKFTTDKFCAQLDEFHKQKVKHS